MLVGSSSAVFPFNAGRSPNFARTTEVFASFALAASGHKSAAGDIHRYIQRQLQDGLGYSEEQAALLTLQIMSEAIKGDGENVAIALGITAYRQQAELAFGPAAA